MRPCVCLSILILLSGCASPPPPKAPKAQADGPRITIGGPIGGCKLIHQVRAVYPKEAKKKRIQGVVRFSALITKTGEVTNIEVMEGHPLLIPAALKAVEQWRYSPCLLNSEPVEVKTQIDINFTLNQ